MLKRFPSSAALYLTPDLKPRPAGDFSSFLPPDLLRGYNMTNPDLAKTFRILAKEGPQVRFVIHCFLELLSP